MNKSFGLLAVVFLAVLPCAAQPLPESQRWVEQVDGGFIFPASGTVARNYNRGVGGDILLGYRLERPFMVGLDVGYYDCDQKYLGTNGGAWVYTSLLAVMRYNFGDGWIRPFLFLGAGVAFNDISLTSNNQPLLSLHEDDPLLSPGAGVLFILDEGVALFIQSRVDMDFTSQISGLAPSNPVLFIPLKLGVSVFPR